MVEELSMHNSNEEQGFTRYGKIGLAIYLISVGLVYLIPNSLPDGILYVWAGVLIFVVTVLNLFKGITYDWFNLIFATFAVIIGANKMLEPNLELDFLPAILVVIGIAALFTNLKKLRYQ